jgi:AdoMet-dependent heme synthase
MSISHQQDFLIQWHLTERCNLRCRHCYQSTPDGDEMSLPEILVVLDEIAQMFEAWSQAYGMAFSPSFTITGGEVFLRDDVFDILSTIKEHGFEISILSNGTLIDAQTARRLGELKVSGVQVSIEGPREVHEKIRGRGTFNAALEGVYHLVTEDIPVTLNATLSALNADHFLALVDVSLAAGVQKLGFSRLVPWGRGRALYDQALTPDQVQSLYKMLFSLNLDGLKLVSGDPLALQMNSPDLDQAPSNIPMGGCAAGVSGITLLPDGTVIPCRRLDIGIGNLRRDSLREIWATSEVLGALRDQNRYSGRCRKCRRWANCRGCRAIAYAWSGGFPFRRPPVFSTR